MDLFSAGVNQPEQVDWLGFSRLGSPDSAPRDAPLRKDTAAVDKPPTSASAGRDVGRQVEGPPSGQTSTSRGMDKGDMRRGTLFDDKAATSSLDWLEMATDGSTEKRPLSPGNRKMSSSTPDDDWLGIRRQSTTEKADSASDYLGLGLEIDLSQKPARFQYCHFSC